MDSLQREMGCCSIPKLGRTTNVWPTACKRATYKAVMSRNGRPRRVGCGKKVPANWREKAGSDSVPVRDRQGRGQCRLLFVSFVQCWCSRFMLFPCARFVSPEPSRGSLHLSRLLDANGGQQIFVVNTPALVISDLRCQDV